MKNEKKKQKKPDRLFFLTFIAQFTNTHTTHHHFSPICYDSALYQPNLCVLNWFKFAGSFKKQNIKHWVQIKIKKIKGRRPRWDDDETKLQCV